MSVLEEAKYALMKAERENEARVTIPTALLRDIVRALPEAGTLLRASDWPEISMPVIAEPNRAIGEALDRIDRAVDGAKQAAAGWIEWNGGERPVPIGTKVDAKFPDGGMARCTDASLLFWGRQNGIGEIIAYRVSKEGGAA